MSHKVQEGRQVRQYRRVNYSICLNAEVDYAHSAHWNVTQQSTEVKQFNRWQNSSDVKPTLHE